MAISLSPEQNRALDLLAQQIGEIVKSDRRRRGRLNQTEYGRLLGVSRQRIHLIEKADTSNMTLRTVVAALELTGHTLTLGTAPAEDRR